MKHLVHGHRFGTVTRAEQDGHRVGSCTEALGQVEVRNDAVAAGEIDTFRGLHLRCESLHI